MTQQEKTQDAKTEHLKIITANRLIDGAVVYMTDAACESGWSEDIRMAAAAHAPEQESIMLARASQAVADCLIVEPYMIPVCGDNHIPVALREKIRAQGPTVRLKDNCQSRPDPAAPAV